MGVGFWACSNAPTDSAPSSSTPSTTSTDVATPSGNAQCYLLHRDDVQEFVSITATDDQLAGSGEGDFPIAAKHYNIRLKGSCSDGKCLVDITRTLDETGETYTQAETWVRDGKHWIVQQRQGAEFDTRLPFIFRPINCPNAEPKNPELFDAIYRFSGGYAVVQRNFLYGVVDTNYKITVQPIYKSLGNINEGTMPFLDSTTNLFGIIDVHGNIIAPAIYTRTTSFSNNRAAVLPTDDNKWGFINRAGKMVINPQYSQINLYEGLAHIQPFSEGLANVNKNQLWGYIDTTGKLLIPFQYTYADAFKNGEARVYKNDRWFYINGAGKCVKNCN